MSSQEQAGRIPIPRKSAKLRQPALRVFTPPLGTARPMSPNSHLVRALHRYGLDVDGRIVRGAHVRLAFDGAGLDCLDVTLTAEQIQALLTEIPANCNGHSAASDVELAILEVLDAFEIGEPRTSEEIARLAGYAQSGWFKQKLTAMARRGTIVSYGRRGYGRCPA